MLKYTYFYWLPEPCEAFLSHFFPKLILLSHTSLLSYQNYFDLLYHKLTEQPGIEYKIDINLHIFIL
jgi:hypothetical protein